MFLNTGKLAEDMEMGIGNSSVTERKGPDPSGAADFLLAAAARGQGTIHP
jgi:hypothetical protein